VPKDRASTSGVGVNQGWTRPRSETLTNDEAKPDAEKSLEEVATEYDRVLEEKIETKTEVGTSSCRPPN
jgi:hypothetical protein